jgi:hypothetical protein
VKKTIVLALIAVFIVAAGTAGAAKPVKLLPPDQTWALGNTPGESSVGTSAPTPVSPLEALAAASLPGAQTEIAAGLTPAQAVGLEPIGTTKGTAGLVTTLGVPAGDPCWTAAMYHGWGTYPLNPRIWEDRTWCATYVGGKISYRTTHVHGETTLCSWSNAYTYRVSGGTGYTWVEARDGMTFECPTTIPYITTHWDRWMQASTNSRGSKEISDYS